MCATTIVALVCSCANISEIVKEHAFDPPVALVRVRHCVSVFWNLCLRFDVDKRLIVEP